MTLFIILENVDLGDFVYGVFDNESQAQIQMDRLIEAWAAVRYIEETERPLDYKTHCPYRIMPIELNSLEDINEKVRWQEDYVQLQNSIKTNKI